MIRYVVNVKTTQMECQLLRTRLNNPKVKKFLRAYLFSAGSRLRLQWRPREKNVEADDIICASSVSLCATESKSLLTCCPWPSLTRCNRPTRISNWHAQIRECRILYLFQRVRSKNWLRKLNGSLKLSPGLPHAFRLGSVRVVPPLSLQRRVVVVS